MDFGSRKPLHMQSKVIAKAASKGSPSYESARDDEINEAKIQSDFNSKRPSSVAGQAVFRRYPNGELDIQWAANQVIDAIHKATYGAVELTTLEKAIIAVVFPDAIDDPMAAKHGSLYLKISASEKSKIKAIVEKQIKDEASWNAGRGGGTSYPNRAG